MPKVLAMTPAEGESPKEFAKRSAAEMESFFGAGAEPAAEPTGEPTDVSAEPEETSAEG